MDLDFMEKTSPRKDHATEFLETEEVSLYYTTHKPLICYVFNIFIYCTKDQLSYLQALK